MLDTAGDQLVVLTLRNLHEALLRACQDAEFALLYRKAGDVDLDVVCICMQREHDIRSHKLS